MQQTFNIGQVKILISPVWQIENEFNKEKVKDNSRPNSSLQQVLHASRLMGGRKQLQIRFGEVPDRRTLANADLIALTLIQDGKTQFNAIRLLIMKI